MGRRHSRKEVKLPAERTFAAPSPTQMSSSNQANLRRRSPSSSTKVRIISALRRSPGLLCPTSRTAHYALGWHCAHQWAPIPPRRTHQMHTPRSV